MKRTGEVEAFEDARALSFPRSERPSPMTRIDGSTLFSTS